MIQILKTYEIKLCQRLNILALRLLIGNKNFSPSDLLRPQTSFSFFSPGVLHHQVSRMLLSLYSHVHDLYLWLHERPHKLELCM